MHYKNREPRERCSLNISKYIRKSSGNFIRVVRHLCFVRNKRFTLSLRNVGEPLIAGLFSLASVQQSFSYFGILHELTFLFVEHYIVYFLKTRRKSPAS